ncbi:glycosyltransferase family 39 protein [Streptomyces sp. Qhu-G9]|uniref:ArnT family glycosyltransferase n=1 Tax=Streptomyces sp. Qhu-G9 TaxID=3452799 RepID=UPI0022AC229F|nr:glycosyltransferase family 39 protein [Streptomyces aurantiacus]WAU79244.1 glycosyltransferase family 39 protein [Streptomyces aurantiacus]
MTDRRTPTWADDSELYDEYGYGQQQGQQQHQHQQHQNPQNHQQYDNGGNGYPQQNGQHQQYGQGQQQYGHGVDQQRYQQQESLRQYAQQAQAQSPSRAQSAYPPQQEQAYQPGYFTETGSWRFDVHGRTTSYPDQQTYDTYAPFDPYASHTAVEPEPVAAPVAPEPEKPGYTLPPVQESAWAVDGGRSKLLGRWVLLCVLFIQTGLSLRLRGTAFQDEALYIAAGHYEVGNILHGTPVPGDFEGYFSGYPKLYPVLAAMADSVGGLAGVRIVSLFFMLGATALLYATTRRMFNVRAALGAAALFSVIQSTVFLGNFATFDAAAIFLLALAFWIIVRTGRSHILAVVLAAPPAFLAFGTKYAAGLYLPTLVVLAVLTAYRHRGMLALVRGAVLGGAMALMLGVAYVFAGSLGGISQTTTDRAKGADTAMTILQHSSEWGGLMFLAALGGSIAYVLRPNMGEMPWVDQKGPGRFRRISLGVVLTGTALLAPAYQIHLQTEISLFKHVGFGLLFAGPMAGLGMSRLVGPHFRHPQLGIILYVLTLVFGMVQSQQAYSFPDSKEMTAILRTMVDRKGSYLAEEHEVPAYYLRDKTDYDQWQSTFGMDYKDKKGKQYSGPDAYRAAVKDAKFDIIVLRGTVTPEVDQAVTDALRGNSHYRLAAVSRFTTSKGDGAFRIWVKR